MNVLATDPYLTLRKFSVATHNRRPWKRFCESPTSFRCTAPRDKSTMKLMDARAFAVMKRGALFISTARGGIHDEAALAMRYVVVTVGRGSGCLGAGTASLDHPLLGMDNVVAMFHTAGVSHEARRNVAAIAAEQIVAAMKGGRPERLIQSRSMAGVRGALRAHPRIPVHHQQDTLE
jgi:D-3-phosphoglycerate dehydrogenase